MKYLKLIENTEFTSITLDNRDFLFNGLEFNEYEINKIITKKI